MNGDAGTEAGSRHILTFACDMAVVRVVRDRIALMSGLTVQWQKADATVMPDVKPPHFEAYNIVSI
jgi:hypothetical protein